MAADIFIPAYKGFVHVRRCLESVIRAGPYPGKVVLYNNASPEKEIAELFRAVSKQQQYELIEVTENRGVLRAYNEGFDLTSPNDFVIVSSDTEVSQGWFQALIACAARERDVATITPLSDNAGIASYPSYCWRNSSELSTDQMQAVAVAANAGRALDVPVGVSFCMLITRRCLDAVGGFDETAFGIGYGEESDLCRRAAGAGLRNLIQGDLFIRHEGRVSFGEDGKLREERANALLEARNPGYLALTRAFVADDPLLPLRRRMDLVRLAACSCPLVLMVSQQPFQFLADQLRHHGKNWMKERELLLLAPRGEQQSLAWLNEAEEFSAHFPAQGSVGLENMLEFIQPDLVVADGDVHSPAVGSAARIISVANAAPNHVTSLIGAADGALRAVSRLASRQISALPAEADGWPDSWYPNVNVYPDRAAS